MGTIIKRKQGNKVYYVYQETYRTKLENSDAGNMRGSGKSKVCTKVTYLGTAEEILRKIAEQ